MQSVSSRIWTRVTVSISYDNNHYTMGTSSNDNDNNLFAQFQVYYIYIILIIFKQIFLIHKWDPNKY